MSLGPLQAPVTKMPVREEGGAIKPSSVRPRLKNSIRVFDVFLKTIPTERTIRSKDLLHHFILLRIGQSHPEIVRPGSIVNF